MMPTLPRLWPIVRTALLVLSLAVVGLVDPTAPYAPPS